MDLTHGIPRELADVVRACDEIAVQIHNRDTSLAWTKVALPAN